MPELPEVETTRRGIAPLLVGQQISGLVVRQRQLRWPIPKQLRQALGNTLTTVQRRGKYLLLETAAGTILIHLGMSGSLRVLPSDTPPQTHDHIDIQFQHGQCLRLRDPRRFGAVLWTRDEPLNHPLLAKLGPEPLGNQFSGSYLFERSRGRKLAVKSFIMNAEILVGVGNIYASESLFGARIHPLRTAGRVSAANYEQLAVAIRQTLQQAITLGGTTLQDFTNSDGEPGYFANQLQVYDRAGEACYHCGKAICHEVLGQRATYFCSHCQK